MVKTGASKRAIGAVLEQDGVPVASESSTTAERDKFMPAYEGELRATLRAPTKLKQFVASKPVTLSALEHLGRAHNAPASP